MIVLYHVRPILGALLALNVVPVFTMALAGLTTANVAVTTVGWALNATKVNKSNKILTCHT